MVVFCYFYRAKNGQQPEMCKTVGRRDKSFVQPDELPCSAMNRGLSHYTAEAHECHSEEAGCKESYRRSFHGFGGVGKFELLTNTSEKHECECKTEGGAESIPRADEQ